jgi:hypothetical protein
VVLLLAMVVLESRQTLQGLLFFGLGVVVAQNTVVEQQGVAVMAEVVLAVLWVLLELLALQTQVAAVEAEN